MLALYTLLWEFGNRSVKLEFEFLELELHRKEPDGIHNVDPKS
jgi:hypothetical protein